MATKQEIEILISPDGEVKLDVKGMKGNACLLEIGKLVQALGTTKAQTLKPEYYEQAHRTQPTKTQSP